MAGPPMPLSIRPGKKDRRAITLANPSQPLPGFAPPLVQRPSKAPDRTREHEPTRPRRPYLFETLRAPLLTRIVADTLDWDGKLQLTFHDPNIPGWWRERDDLTVLFFLLMWE